MTRIYLDVRDVEDAEFIRATIDRTLIPYRMMRGGVDPMTVQMRVLPHGSEHEREWTTREEDMKSDQ